MNPIEEKLPFLPARPGVYLMKGPEGRVLYVGKAKNLRARLRSYLGPQAEANPKVSFLVPKVRELETIVTRTEKEAFLLENTLIKKHRPRYNIELKDDKTYLHILLDRNHPYPRFVPVRRPGRPRPGQLLFGPYSSASAIRDTLRQIHRLYPLRTCKDGEFGRRTRPCLQGQMGRCACACVGGISQQAYREMVDQAVLILQGRSRELVRGLQERMQDAAAALRFEEAAGLRDRIQAIRLSVERQRVVSDKGEDRDVLAAAEEGSRVAVAVLQVRDGQLTDRQSFVFSGRVIPLPELLGSFLHQFYTAPGRTVPPEVLLPFEPEDREPLEEVLSEIRGSPLRLKVPVKGEKRRLLDLAELNARSLLEEQARKDDSRASALAEIQRKASLPGVPERIECFDISNLGGRLAVGSRVTFRGGLPWKDGYRRYRIRTVSGSDDYAMMYEVLRRRFEKRQGEERLPDLLLVDGGKGHLGVALRVLRDLGIEGVQALAIAKARREGPGRGKSGSGVTVGQGASETGTAGPGGASRTEACLNPAGAEVSPGVTHPGEPEALPGPRAGPGPETGESRQETQASSGPGTGDEDAAPVGALPGLGGPGSAEAGPGGGVNRETVELPACAQAGGPGARAESRREEAFPLPGGGEAEAGEGSAGAGEGLTDRLFRPGRVNPLAFSSHSPGLRLLQQVRDEAHRFAVTYHRKLRSRELVKSTLDEIPGVGPARKKALFRAFGDLNGVLAATIEELSRVPGMSEAAARVLWDGLHACGNEGGREHGGDGPR